MEKKERKMIGVSVDLHDSLKSFCKEKGVSMTTAIDALVNQDPAIDWKQAKADAKARAPSFKNVRKAISEYRTKYPEADALQISKFTGFTHYQCRVVMHEANKDCMKHLVNGPIAFGALAKAANVSDKFAIRILGQMRGEVKIPQQEEYLWDLSGDLPAPRCV